MPALHQFVPTFEPGAVGAHMIELQRLWRESGRGDSEVFAEHIHPDYEGTARRYDEYGTRRYPAGRDDVLVYQMAIGSVVADFVGRRRERLVLNHHNLTPVEFLEQWEPTATWGVQWGHQQLRELAGRTELAIAVSDYNAAQLRSAGYRRVEVAPLLLGSSTAAEPEGDVPSGGWLFVGRLAANKCQHDVVRAFAMYRAVFDPEARLYLVGGAPADAYRDALDGLVAKLGLEDAVTITGGVTPGRLTAHYRAADVFVCLSEHEGFCAPLLEAMQNDLPVIAYDAAAVPETVGDAALLLKSKRPATVAAAADRVVRDGDVRKALIEAGRRRVEHFAPERVRRRWLHVLAGL